MFTGIVERTGKIADVKIAPGGKQLIIDAEHYLDGLALGASIAINGCCVTAVNYGERTFLCDLMSITLERTNLGDLQAGDVVNLERPMKLGEELGGHIVQGHIEGVGEVTQIVDTHEDRKISIRIPRALTKYVVKTGSIALDGVSMTVAEIESDEITVGVIPHTWDITNFHTYRIGSHVNIETDFLAKHIEKLLAHVGITRGAEEIAAGEGRRAS